MSEKNEHIDHENLIAKYLGGLADKEELQLLLKWIEADVENKKYFLEAKDIWDVSEKQRILPQIDSESAYRKFHERIIKYSDDNLTSIQIPKNKLYPILRYFVPAAAVIIIGISIWFIFYKKVEWKVVASNEKRNVPIVLPDSSTIYLNKNSEIKYPEKFEGNYREVLLIGEAFFEINPNKEKPFVVHAGKVKVEVFGTSFNINAYSKNDKVVVTVKSGKVSLFQEDDNGNRVSEVSLSKGERGELDIKTGKVSEVSNTNLNYLAWKTDLLVFKDTKIKEALNAIEKHYSVDINVANDEFLDCNITAKFDSQPIEDVWVILELAFKINIEGQGNSFIIKGKGCDENF